MKTILRIITLFFSLQAHADIYVCRDNQKRTIYQDEPCAVEMTRKLKILPAPSAEAQLLAQERVRRSNEIWQQRALQRRQDEMYALELERLDIEKRKLELLEEQALASEQAVPIFAHPNFRYGFDKHGFNKFGMNRPHSNKHGDFDTRTGRNRSKQP
ncbi:MAG TPA: DUF4124 domain-containing protein [Methylotenera sp.]|nr:DUF4124 domain-containing protein [Methylotenera sp.]